MAAAARPSVRPGPERARAARRSRCSTTTTSGPRVEVAGDLSRRAEAEDVEIAEARPATACASPAARLDRLRLVDVVVEGCELSGVCSTRPSSPGSSSRDCRMAGIVLTRAKLRDVRFVELQARRSQPAHGGGGAGGCSRTARCGPRRPLRGQAGRAPGSRAATSPGSSAPRPTSPAPASRGQRSPTSEARPRSPGCTSTRPRSCALALPLFGALGITIDDDPDGAGRPAAVGAERWSIRRSAGAGEVGVATRQVVADRLRADQALDDVAVLVGEDGGGRPLDPVAIRPDRGARWRRPCARVVPGRGCSRSAAHRAAADAARRREDDPGRRRERELGGQVGPAADAGVEVDRAALSSSSRGAGGRRASPPRRARRGPGRRRGGRRDPSGARRATGEHGAAAAGDHQVQLAADADAGGRGQPGQAGDDQREEPADDRWPRRRRRRSPR